MDILAAIALLVSALETARLTAGRFSRARRFQHCPVKHVRYLRTAVRDCIKHVLAKSALFRNSAQANLQRQATTRLKGCPSDNDTSKMHDQKE